jgi:hypothetical protein
VCKRCGLVIDRDVNAARSLLQLAVRDRGAGGAKRRPNGAGHVGMEQELGAAGGPQGTYPIGFPAHVGKDETVAGQLTVVGQGFT